MTPKTLAELMKLSPSEREELVTRDWENHVDDDGLEAEELDDELRAELDRRWAEHLADPGSAIPWAEVRRKLMSGE
jgi:putative addiction module component (TIGR02574 family)